MKLTDKMQAGEMQRSNWPLYDQCSGHIGTILDDKFEDPHIVVYEHVRHTSEEVFKHAQTFGNYTYPISTDTGQSDRIEDEQNIIDLLESAEARRRLNIVGDVGVGKTTFLLHLIDVHVGKSPGFGAGFAVYISWADFAPSSFDVMRQIKQRFVLRIAASLDKALGPSGLDKLDDDLFDEDDLFVNDRSIARKLNDELLRRRHIAESIGRAMRELPVEFAFARINHLCRTNRNAILLVIDNIDHLPETVLKELSAFLVEIQMNSTPILLVGMRDHTYNRGFSLYREDKAIPCWHSRLKPPNIKLLLARRINHFFSEGPIPRAQTVTVGAGVLKIDRETAKVCSTLLNAPFADIETYDFICGYANYSIRDLFIVLQSIIGSPGFSGFNRDLFLGPDSRLHVGIDECLISLGLGRYWMFYPDHSPLFNPYSAGADDNPLDKIVAARILQLLDNRILPISFRELSSRLSGWGYSKFAIDAQVRAMVNKDIVWTSTGAPSQFAEDSNIRLSYRGQLYARKILRRAVYNYMMSFDVRPPDENHAIFRHHKSEFKTELSDFATFDSRFDTAAISQRVLGLADVIAESERREVKQLRGLKEMSAFKADVAPSAVCLGIVDGLEKFLLSALAKNGNGSRYMAPSTATMKEVGDAKVRYAREFRNAHAG